MFDQNQLLSYGLDRGLAAGVDSSRFYWGEHCACSHCRRYHKIEAL